MVSRVAVTIIDGDGMISELRWQCEISNLKFEIYGGEARNEVGIGTVIIENFAAKISSDRNTGRRRCTGSRGMASECTANRGSAVIGPASGS
jgi:hypothetical protein